MWIIKVHAINGTGKCHKCVKCGEPTKYSQVTLFLSGLKFPNLGGRRRQPFYVCVHYRWFEAHRNKVA
jgi:hypothetical protein